MCFNGGMTTTRHQILTVTESRPGGIVPVRMPKEILDLMGDRDDDATAQLERIFSTFVGGVHTIGYTLDIAFDSVTMDPPNDWSWELLDADTDSSWAVESFGPVHE